MAIEAGIDANNSVRIQTEIVGEYKTVGYGAVFDSGFTGDVVLPQSMAVDIGLKSGGVAEIELADGHIMVVKLYLCKIKLGEVVQDAAVIIMGEEVLLGMGLMAPFDVCLRVSTLEAVIEPQQSSYGDFVGILKRLTGT